MEFITNPKHAEELSSYMERQYYSPIYIQQHVQVYHFIIKRIPKYNWESFDDVRTWISEQNYNPSYKQRLIRIVSHIEYFTLYGRIPNDYNYQENHLPSFIPDPNEYSNYLHEHGVYEAYAQRHICLVRSIIRDAPKYSWNSIDDVIDWYSNQNYTVSYIKDTVKILKNIEYYHSYGRLRGPNISELQHQFKNKTPSIGSLDLSFWNDSIDELLTCMKDSGYSDSYLKLLSLVCRKITVLSRTINWTSYDEILDWYRSQNYDDSYLINVRAVLGILEAYHMRNTLPNNRGTQNVLCLRDNSFSHLNPDFKELVNTLVKFCKCKNLKPSTITTRWSVLSVFLYSMQSAGATTIEEITEDMVFNYFSERMKQYASYAMSKTLHLVLSDLSYTYPECKHLKMLIPVIQTGRKNIQYLTEEESRSFEDVLIDNFSNISMKSRAIGTILYYNGMRSSDITNLRLDSIDLRNNTISFYQVKTGNPISIPLLPVVGNAIVDYCTNERPLTKSNHLFVGNQAPHHPNGNGSVYAAVDNIMKEANIRRHAGDRKGSHLFRYRVVTTLLENNVSPAVVSSITGHSSPNSLNPYAYADFIHLKECALSIADYTLPEEVFDYV